MKINSLLAGTLALVLIAGFVSPAFAQSTTQSPATPSDFDPENFVISSHGPLTIGLTVGFNFPNVETVLTGAGHTVINPVNLDVPLTVDVLYLNRAVANSLTAAQITNIQNFLASGGTVLSEFSATNLWFDGTLASLAGTLTNDFFRACCPSLVTVVDTTSPLSIALPATWNSNDPIEFFQVYSGLDPSINVAIEVQGTNEGDLPVVGCVDNVGGGTAVLFFTDYEDFNGNETPEEEQLLLNAVDIQSCIDLQVGGELLPIDSTALMLAGAQSFSWMIPLVLSGIGIGLFVVSRKSENS